MAKDFCATKIYWLTILLRVFNEVIYSLNKALSPSN